ncbi:hypothetical protein [Bartonella sp. F02]|uniref:hypothetical protein n=1 Tax=Bartonella sp. F02 TaxID=2967262 RepID=UPI0022A9CF6B|nr:hypothetical protein [Bartonella sp. F02]
MPIKRVNKLMRLQRVIELSITTLMRVVAKSCHCVWGNKILKCHYVLSRVDFMQLQHQVIGSR